MVESAEEKGREKEGEEVREIVLEEGNVRKKFAGLGRMK